MDHKAVQAMGKVTMEYIKTVLKPGMGLKEVRRLCEKKMLELGADSFWYWNVGAFVFSGKETTLSVSGREYETSDRVLQEEDIITIDLSPQREEIWGDYARTIILEKGKVVENLDCIRNEEWKAGLQMEQKLHRELYDFLTAEISRRKVKVFSLHILELGKLWETRISHRILRRVWIEIKKQFWRQYDNQKYVSRYSRK